MADLTSLDEVTDTWVLDYLTRRCDPSLAKAFKNERGISDETPVECPYGLTLEKVALPYVKSSPAPLYFHSVSFPGGRKPLPQLPELVIQEILSYLPTNDLFSTRFLSRDWNAMCSESLRKRNRVPIRLQSVDQICKLAKTLRSGNWLSPFTAYHFFPEQGGTLDLLKVIGRHVKLGIFELTSKGPVTPDKVLNLLDLTPFIEEVTFDGHCDMVHVKGPVLRHLRKLSLSVNRSENDQLALSVLQNWHQLAPALQDLRCDYTICPSTNDDFRQFAQLCSSLRRVSLHAIACPRDADWQVPAILPSADLSLEIRSVKSNNKRSTSKLIEALSGSLNRLSLTLGIRHVKLGAFPKLSYLRMSGIAYSFSLSLPAISFSSLRSVTLEVDDVNADEWRPVDRDGEPLFFPTVTTLRLIFHADADSKLVFFDWGVVFPELTSLGVASGFYESIINSIVQGFDHVTHLHLCDTGTRRQGDGSLAKGVFDLFDSQKKWTFLCFKDLEHLDVECSWDLRRLILKSVTFAADQLMPPLHNLTIIHSCADAHAESDLFECLRGLKYHDDVRLIFQEEPSYKAW